MSGVAAAPATAAVVADTHALIWYLDAPQNLSPVALAALDGATAAGEAIYLSAISLVEVTYLVEKGRLPGATQVSLDRALGAPGAALAVVPLDRAVARALASISRTDVPDMPDRIIAVTALHLNVPLVTRDLKIQASSVVTIW